MFSVFEKTFASAAVLLLILLGGSVLLDASSPWHPPGEEDPVTFDCHVEVDQTLECVAHGTLKYRVPFPNQWPRWLAYPEDRSGLSDKDRGLVAHLDLEPGERYVIVLKPHPHPSTWVSKAYDVEVTK